jgi:hypothetical protein
MATLYDMHPLEVLLNKAIEESGGLLPPYDQFHCYHQFLHRLENGLVYVACEIVGDKQERIVGALMMDLHKFDWNPQAKLLVTVHLYIVPEYRGKTMPDGKTYLFEALLGFGQQLADVAQIPFMVESFFQLGPEARAVARDKAFEKAGFQYLGGKHNYQPKAPRQAEQSPAAAA